MKTKIEVKQPQPEIPVQILAQAIVDLAAAFKKVQTGPLSQRALILLVQDACGASRINRDQVKLVLDALPELEEIYVRKAVK